MFVNYNQALCSSSDSSSESESETKTVSDLKEEYKKEEVKKEEDADGEAEKDERDTEVGHRVDYMITGDQKERFFSDEEADREIEDEIKDSNLTKEKCIQNAKYLCTYLQVKCNEEPSLLVVEELQYIIDKWNQKGKLCLEHDLKKPEIKKHFWYFLEMVFANLERIEYSVLSKMVELLEAMGQKKGVFAFDQTKIKDMQTRLMLKMNQLEKEFLERAKQNIKNRKKRKLIRKMNRKKNRFNK
jgi:hypothetical protein